MTTAIMVFQAEGQQHVDVDEEIIRSCDVHPNQFYLVGMHRLGYQHHLLRHQNSNRDQQQQQQLRGGVINVAGVVGIHRTLLARAQTNYPGYSGIRCCATRIHTKIALPHMKRSSRFIKNWIFEKVEIVTLGILPHPEMECHFLENNKHRADGRLSLPIIGLKCTS